MSGSTERTVGSHQLDFYQAMADFKLMFPNMDDEIIEAVLRTNNGAVDGTIDQLLTMNSDLGVVASSSAANDDVANALTASSLSFNSSDQVLPLGHMRPKRIVELRSMNRLLTLETSSSSYDDDVFQSCSALDATSKSYNSRTDSKSSAKSSPCGRVFGIVRPQQGGSQTLGNGGCPSTISSVSTFSTNENLLLLETTTDDSSHLRDSSLELVGGAFDETDRIHETPFQEASFWDDPGFLPPTPAPPIHPRSPLPVAPPLPPKMSLVGNRGQSAGNHQCIEAKRSTGRQWDPPMLGRLPDDFLRLDIGTNSSSKVSLRTSPSGRDGGRPRITSDDDDLLLRSVKPSSRVKPLKLNSETTTNRNHRHSASTGDRKSHDGVLSASSHACDCHHLCRSSPHSAALDGRLPPNSSSSSDHRRLEIDADVWQMLEDERLALVLQSEEFLAELRQNEDFMRTLENEHHLHIFSEDTQIKSSLPGKSLQSSGDPTEFQTMLKQIGDTSKKKLIAAAQKFFAKCKKKSQKPVSKDNVAPSTVNLLDDEDVEKTDNADENPFGHCEHWNKRPL